MLQKHLRRKRSAEEPAEALRRKTCQWSSRRTRGMSGSSWAEVSLVQLNLDTLVLRLNFKFAPPPKKLPLYVMSCCCSIANQSYRSHRCDVPTAPDLVISQLFVRHPACPRSPTPLKKSSDHNRDDHVIQGTFLKLPAFWAVWPSTPSKAVELPRRG